MPHHVLVVDDDADVRRLVRDYLKAEGFRVSEACDGASALEAFRTGCPDLVVLDVMMPGIDGMEVCRRIRASSPVLIVFLTARADEVDQLLGFGFGADDYVTKPFSPRALVARVKALLRRASGGAGGGVVDGQAARVRYGELEVNPVAFTVTVSGEPVELTTKEFLLLNYLVQRPETVVTKRQLVMGAWGEEYMGDDSALMVHLSHLRQKLGGGHAWINTVRGVGYKFTPGARGTT